VFAWPEPAAGAGVGAPVHLQLSANGALLSLQLPGGHGQAQAAAGRARQWLLDLSSLKDLQDERPAFLRLDWPASSEGLSSAVQIERSEDGQQWSAAGQGRVLALAAAGAPRIDQLDWASTQPLPRYLRLRFEAPLALTSATLSLSRRQAAPAPLQQAVHFEPLAGEAPQWQLDLQGRVAPRALALQLPPGNQVLNLRLEQRNADSEAWRAVARFVAWRLQRGGFDGSSPPQALASAAPARFWRLTAEAPTPLQGQVLPALLHWQPPQLVLLAQGQPSEGFQLAVGRAGMLPAHASTAPASLLPGYREGDEYKLPEASLAALQLRPEPGWPQRIGESDPAARRRWLLWAVLIAAVLGLAWMARGLFAQIKRPGG